MRILCTEAVCTQTMAPAPLKAMEVGSYLDGCPRTHRFTAGSGDTLRQCSGSSVTICAASKCDCHMGPSSPYGLVPPPSSRSHGKHAALKDTTRRNRLEGAAEDQNDNKTPAGSRFVAVTRGYDIEHEIIGYGIFSFSAQIRYKFTCAIY